MVIGCARPRSNTSARGHDTTGRMTGRPIGIVTTYRDTVKGVAAWRLVFHQLRHS
jgi:hypothetical protein